MTGAEVSVIVPVYNAESCVSETLECLRKQSLPNLEVILVDDGSTDRSPAVLEAYCRSYAGFRVLHIRNGGVYNARLAGIQEAKGRYIAFCDSDDLPLPQMLEKLYQTAERTGADMTVCGYTREEMDSGRVLSREMLSFGDGSRSGRDLLDLLPVVNAAVWNKLFRADLLQHVIRFRRPPRVLEDAMFCCSLYPFIRSVAFVPEVLYRYRMHRVGKVLYPDNGEVSVILEDMVLTRDYVLDRDDSPDMRELMDTAAFVHIGLSLLTRRVQEGENAGRAVRRTRRYLEQYFPGYRRAGKGVIWNLQHGGQQARILAGRWFFRARLMWLFLPAYSFVTQKCGKEIKW